MRTAPKSIPGDSVKRTNVWRQSPHDARRERRREREFQLYVVPETQAPCSYGLTPAELRAEAARLLRMGWSEAEIRARLVDPKRVVA